MTESRRETPFLRNAAITAGIFLAVLTAYWPALRAGFIWNDSDYLTKPSLRSLHGLGRIWFELGATEQYYPILHSAFWLEHRLWGDSALGYHLVNVLLHATSAWLLVVILSRLFADETLTRSAPRSVGAERVSVSSAPLLAGLIFALHPVCVESVAWISEQKNTLSTLFYLLAGLAYLRWRARPPAHSAYWLATFLFVLALLSKSVTATLPAALLVVLWWRKGRLEGRRDVVPLLPWFAAGAAMGLFSAWVERTYIGAQGAHFGLTLAQRCAVAGHAFWFYLGKLLWPAHLVFIYPRWQADGSGAARWLYAVAAAAALLGLGLLARRRRGPLAAFLFFLGSLFPTLGFFNVYAFVFSYVADHWQYLASLGIFALAGSALAFAWGSFAPVRTAVVTALLLVLGLLTWRQCRMYRDVETLYRVTIERNPDSWLAHVNLGVLLSDAGRFPEAIGQFRSAGRLAPDYPEIHANLADALLRAGRTDEALAEYEQAVRLGPGYAPAQVNLANTLVLAGRGRESIPHYRAALRLLPGDAGLELGLGTALDKAGRLDEAAEHEAEALRLRPDFPEAEYQFANTLANGGRVEQAIAHYRAAVRLRPAYAEARANLGLALATAGRPGEALPELDEALQLRPAYAEAHAYLGLALARLGRLREAAAEYRSALRLSPGAADVHYQLALVLRSLGEIKEATAEFQAARSPAP